MAFHNESSSFTPSDAWNVFPIPTCTTIDCIGSNDSTSQKYKIVQQAKTNRRQEQMSYKHTHIMSA